MTKKETNLSTTLSEAVSVATSVAYTKQEIQKLKTEFVSLLEKKTSEVLVEQVPGPIGPRGAIGATGAQGPKGDKGDKGDRGERGEKGEVGPQGNMGNDGLRGLKGEKGDKGDKGEKGDIGPQGIPGERGPQGLKGDRGEDGKNGLDGKDGQAGAMGPVGPAGQQGLQGERGPKGDRGERGQDGQQGIQGPVGPAGPKGDTGPQGLQGVAGKDGKDGDIKPVEEKFQKFIENVQKDVNAFKTKVNAAILKSGPNDAWKSTGSGEVNLRYLDDVDRDSIADGYVLSYNDITQKFQFVSPSAASFNPLDVKQVFAEVKNDENFTITRGQAVFLYSATGNKAAVILANNTSDSTSAKTLGLVYSSSITPGGTGYIITQGVVAGVDTSMYQEGDTLYLANTAGNLTSTKPYAPQHLVYIGVVERANQGQGQIYVRPQNGYELDELHNVNIDHNVALSNADILVYNTTNSLWENRPVSYLGLSTSDNFARTIANSAYSQANTALSIAQSAFAQANTGGAAGTDNLARSIANSAFSTANLAYTQANTSSTLAQAAYDAANTKSTFSGSYTDLSNKPDLTVYLTSANLTPYATTSTTNTIATNVASAWSTANSATTLAQAAYNYANTIVSDTQIDPFARSQANSAFNQANTATSNAATANSIAVSAFAQANAAVVQATNGILRASDANTLATNAFTRANTAYTQANTATTLAQSAYDYANTIVVPSLSGYAVNTTVNLVWSTANSAYTQANTGTTLAQAAYNQANNGLSKDYTLNTVTSNTSIGTADSRELFLCDTSNNVVLTMPAGNTVSDGFNFKVTRLGSGEVTLAGAYGDNVIRGIKFGDITLNFNTVYDEPLSAYENVLLDGEYKPSQLTLSSFDNQTSFELVSINDTEYALLQGTVLPSGTQDFAIEDYNDLINTPNLSVYATTATTNTISNNVASAWSTANLAYTQANTATTLAQSAYDFANTIVSDTQIDPLARSISNSAFAQANTATTNAAIANNQAASAFSQANTATTNASIANNIAASAFNQANTANSVAYSAFSKANTAITTSGGTVTGNVVITYQPASTVGQALTINGANTQGGTGYVDFLKVTNTSGGATNPNKTFRLTSTGDVEIINSAYNANLFSLTNAGGLSVPGPISIGGKQAVNGPAFRAHVATGQTITSGSQQKVTFGTENFDTNNNFASSRFTPTIEGYYQFNATVRIDGTSSTGECMIILYKNGAEYARGHNQSGTEQGASFYSMTVSDIAYANGTGDYFEVYIQQTSGGNRNTTAGSPISYFSGVMVRGA